MKKLLTLLFLTVTTLSYAQQLKLGSNPSVIKKSALLELETGSQGLLLPRISDTTSTTIKSSPDGMLIYLTLNNSLTIRSLGAWQSLGLSPTFTLTGDVTGTGTGTVASTISNQAVTFAKLQNINTQKLLGRYTAGAGSTQEVSLDNSLKLNTGGTLYADSALAIWNASKLIGLRVSSKAPANGEVLKWNGTAWESNTDNGGTVTLTGDVTGSGTGTVASTISNQAVTFAKMQNINTQKLLGRYTAGAGSPQEVSLDNSLKLNTGGTLYADSALAIWNASKLIGLRVSSKTPASGEVLKWNGTAWESNTDNDGGATYGTLADNDISNADVAGSTTRLKIWGSPVTGVVTNGVAGTTAHAWNVMSFKGNGGGGFTTQLYFDKNTLALREWTGTTAPLGTTAINGWYKAIMTNGNTNISNGSIIFGNITSDASTEVGQDNANFFWDNTNKRLGIKTNAPTSTLYNNGSFSLPIRGAGASTTLTESDYTVVKNTGADITITLPNANTCKGRIYVIKKANAGILIISSSGGQIDAAGTSVTLTSGQRVSYTIQSDGGNWWIIAGI
ncbi:hypothetical protein [Chitinophaga sp. CF418]|uniref:hypothetical protein n=1 Tax=Chitinophaga sp. CF418 TaxID=1855287 RepID=UPI000911E06F|nr:hypothetical protein [Chitinophaga sp. CF418]SHL95968.1 hypothetical protein SAMN05216311_101235 [Chitinophaga sp. CF418]